MLSYWLSCLFFQVDQKYGINPFVFLIAVVLAKRERLDLPPIYLGSLYALDECVGNITLAVERYDVVTQPPQFFANFLMGKIGTVVLKPVEFSAAEMIEVVVEGVKKQKQSTP